MEIIFVYTESQGVQQVFDAENTIDPEDWVRTWGVRNYPEAIYFIATVEMA